MTDYVFIVPEDSQGMRLDAFVTAQEELSLTRSTVQRLIEQEQILVKGRQVKTGYKLRSGMLVTVSIPDLAVYPAQAEDISLDILYEDSDIIVVNKPQGLVVHPSPGHLSGTLVNALLFHCKDLSGIGGELRPGIVHRLDKDTSGVLLAAKNDRSHVFIAKQLEDRKVKRLYQGIVTGVMKQDEGIINKNIARHQNDRQRMAVTQSGGREAITHYRVISRLRRHTHIEARLGTGRTHQIRVHMQSIGYPILGDPVYGKPSNQYPAQALHAYQLGVIHPNGEYMEFTAEPPFEFVELLGKL